MIDAELAPPASRTLTTSTLYDPNGNVIQVTDARLVVTKKESGPGFVG